MKKKKLKPLPVLKRNLWKIFSEYIRRRDSDSEGFGRCISCGAVGYYKEMHAGHYIPKSLGLSIYFEEKNVNLQCLTKESSIRMFNGTYKGIGYVRAGEFIWAFNESNFSLEKAVVESVKSFVPKTLYEVELEDGKKFYATGDHRVVSKGKWVAIEEMLHDVSAYDIMEI